MIRQWDAFSKNAVLQLDKNSISLYVKNESATLLIVYNKSFDKIAVDEFNCQYIIKKPRLS